VHLLALLPDFLSPEKLIDKGGLLLVTLIVFAETGLLVGFFLPGDSLLFVAGFLSSKPKGLPHLPALPIVVACIVAAAIIGDQVGYTVGQRLGPSIFRRPDSKLFKQAHVAKAQAFFDKHGSKTIVLARFVPIVRTFAPVLAGVSGMHRSTYLKWNVLGGLLWGGLVTTAGYFLGQVDVVKNNIEIAIPLIVLLSLVPVGIEVVRHRRNATADATH
jgi:membrane-associated protein